MPPPSPRAMLISWASAVGINVGNSNMSRLIVRQMLKLAAVASAVLCQALLFAMRVFVLMKLRALRGGVFCLG